MTKFLSLEGSSYTNSTKNAWFRIAEVVFSKKASKMVYGKVSETPAKMQSSPDSHIKMKQILYFNCKIVAISAIINETNVVPRSGKSSVEQVSLSPSLSLSAPVSPADTSSHLALTCGCDRERSMLNTLPSLTAL